jgi:hypothetical protein
VTEALGGMRSAKEGSVKKIKIFRKDGHPTPYFYWSNEIARDPKKLQVYKSASHGVERVKGVFFNTETNCMNEGLRQT